jgi:hypothetical protein
VRGSPLARKRAALPRPDRLGAQLAMKFTDIESFEKRTTAVVGRECSRSGAERQRRARTLACLCACAWRSQVFDNAIKVILKNGQMLTFRSILKRDKVLEGLKAMQAWNIELEHGCARAAAPSPLCAWGNANVTPCRLPRNTAALTTLEDPYVVCRLTDDESNPTLENAVRRCPPL